MRRHLGAGLAVIGYLLLMLQLGTGLAAAGALELIPDQQLEQHIRVQLNKPDGELNADDLSQLRYLDATVSEVVYLEGLQYATNLTVLMLNDNDIYDISPIEGLNQLSYVNLENNLLDISESSDAGHTIRTLEQQGTTVHYGRQRGVTLTDPVLAEAIRDTLGIHHRVLTEEDMKQLTYLDVSQRTIVSLEGLQYADNLAYLLLGYTQIHDVTPLQRLTSVKYLDINGIDIDVSPGSDNQVVLERLVNGGAVVKFENKTYVPPVVIIPVEDDVLEAGIRSAIGKPSGDLTRNDLEQITSLTVTEGVKSIKGISAAVNLTYLNLDDNAISNINELERLQQLETLNIRRNRLDTQASSAAMQVIRSLERNGTTVNYQPQKQVVSGRLSSLNVSNGMVLSPSFNKNISFYNVSVSEHVTNFRVTPYAESNEAAITVNGQSVTSGQPSHSIALNTISTIIAIEVTGSEDTQTYTLVVTKGGNSADLSGLTLGGGLRLSPEFQANTTQYNAVVSESASSILISPAASDSTATIKINDSIVSSGSSRSVNLTADTTTILVKVTASNGVNTKTYTLRVTKNVDPPMLENLQLSDGAQLSPAFDPEKTNYNVTTQQHVSQLSVLPFAASGTAVRVNGEEANIGAWSQPLELKPGVNAFDIEVRSPRSDSAATTYTLRVVRDTPTPTNVAVPMNGNDIEQSNGFTDIGNHWARHEIELLASMSILDGQSETSFAPDSPISRAEFITILVRALSIQTPSESIPFKDVTSQDWFSNNVSAAVKAGIVQGFDDQTFRPKKQISREEMAVMVMNALRNAVVVDSASASQRIQMYQDYEEISSWAREAVSVVVGIELMKGTSGEQYSPKQASTRAQAAVIVARVMKYMQLNNRG
jgi:hypothetical protein